MRRVCQMAGPMLEDAGVQIDRLTALPGVLAYKRDEVIDVRAGGAVASN